jgi:hypothetical protein
VLPDSREAEMRKLYLALGAVVVMLSLLAVLVMTRPDAFTSSVQAEDGRPERVMVIAVEKIVNGERVAGELQVRFEDPDDLPAAPPGVSGLFLGRDGNLITVGQGSIEVDVEVVNDQDPVRTVRAEHSGGEAQIRLTEATTYLADVTEMPEISDADIAAGELVVTRILESGSLGELAQPMMIRAWGVDQGGEFVADLMVYEPIQ